MRLTGFLRTSAALLAAITILTHATALADDGDDAGEASPSIIPVIVAVGGVALLGLGVLFSLQASGAEDDARSATEHAMAFDSAESAESLTNTANLMYLGGAALLAVGIGWFSVELTDARDANATALSIGPTSLALRTTFR